MINAGYSQEPSPITEIGYDVRTTSSSDPYGGPSAQQLDPMTLEPVKRSSGRISGRLIIIVLVVALLLLVGVVLAIVLPLALDGDDESTSSTFTPARISATVNVSSIENESIVWKPALADKTSTEYQQLKTKITPWLLSSCPADASCEVEDLTFTPGSVIMDFTMAIGASVDASQTLRALEQTASSFNIGYMDLVSEDATTTRSSTTATANTGTTSTTCPEGQVYSSCARACDSTCAEPNPICIEVCTQRCFCSGATPIFHEGGCISLAQCPVSCSETDSCPVPLGINANTIQSGISPSLKEFGVQCPNTNDTAAAFNAVITSPAEASLRAYTLTFGEARHEKVADSLHIFLSYNLSNTIVIEAPEGLIIVDSGDCTASARNILRDIRTHVSNATIQAVVLTHFHGDHVGGLQVYVDESPNLKLYVHKDFERFFFVELADIRSSSLNRAIRMLGVYLPDSIRENGGLGPRLCLPEGILRKSIDYTLKTEKETLTIAGLTVDLVHIPGETADQIGVYIPSMKAFIVGDDYYKTFPNLYTIRGTRARDVKQWYRTIDDILSYDIEYLLPCHTQPIIGKTNITTELMIYRDAMQYLYDQTVRFINKGFTKEAIAQHLRLPSNLRSQMSLEEHYGVVEFSVKGIFTSLVGWFSGELDDLFPLTRPQESSRWLEMLSADMILSKATEALQKDGVDDLKWALQLSSVVWYGPIEVITEDQRTQVRKLRVDIVTKLATFQPSPNARNYLLGWVLEENCNVPTVPYFIYNRQNVQILPSNILIETLPVMFDAEIANDTAMSVLLHVNDTEYMYSLVVRNSILTTAQMNATDTNTPTVDLEITTDSATFRQILLGAVQVDAPTTQISVSDVTMFKTFLSFLETTAG